MLRHRFHSSRLYGPAGFVASQAVSVSGDGAYTADAVVSSPGAYTWEEFYLGDPLNSVGAIWGFQTAL